MESRCTPLLRHVNRLTLATHRARRSLDQLHDTQTEPAVGNWQLRILNAVHEMFSFDAQRLRTIELRRPHVAGPVADSHLVDLLRVIGEVDALVVDLDLLARLEIVVGDPFLAATAHDPAYR